eukprot:1300685-Ditylum_brightwellii.AAC.1
MSTPDRARALWFIIFTDIDQAKATNAWSKEVKCISSIFEMDMGSTLAKLVYFEQESCELSLQQQRE